MRLAWLGRFESHDLFRIVARIAVAKIAPFRRYRRFVGNLKFGLPSWPVFACPQQAGSSASSVRRLVELSGISGRFHNQNALHQVEAGWKASKLRTYERNKR
jgi:hypothetical protein